jgi:hypothetical protein
VACQEISPLAIYQLIMSDFDTTMVWQGTTEHVRLIGERLRLCQ